jgi:transposase InsO family protein
MINPPNRIEAVTSVQRRPRQPAEAVLRQLPSWIAHYNEVHPHKALGYRSPRELAHEKP